MNTLAIPLTPLAQLTTLTVDQLIAQRELLTHYPTRSVIYCQRWPVVNLCIELKHQQAIEAAARKRVSELEQRLMEVVK